MTYMVWKMGHPVFGGPFKILNGPREEFYFVLEHPKPLIAHGTQNPTNQTSLMTMINMWIQHLSPTNRTQPKLLYNDSIPVWAPDSVELPKLSIKLVKR